MSNVWNGPVRPTASNHPVKRGQQMSQTTGMLPAAYDNTRKAPKGKKGGKKR